MPVTALHWQFSLCNDSSTSTCSFLFKKSYSFVLCNREYLSDYLRSYKMGECFIGKEFTDNVTLFYDFSEHFDLFHVSPLGDPKIWELRPPPPPRWLHRSARSARNFSKFHGSCIGEHISPYFLHISYTSQLREIFSPIYSWWDLKKFRAPSLCMGSRTWDLENFKYLSPLHIATGPR